MRMPASIARCWRSFDLAGAADRPACAGVTERLKRVDRAAAGLHRADAAGAPVRHARPPVRRPGRAERHYRRRWTELRRTAIRSTTRTSAMPAPANSLTSSAPNGPATSRSTTRQVLSGREAASRRSSRYSRAASRSSSAARSDAAIEVAGKHADVFALWGETYEQVRDVTARVRAAAAKHGRPTPRFSLSVRPILADTEEKAWTKAEAILERATALQDQTGYRQPATATRPRAPSGCWRRRTRARASTSGCGPRSQSSPAPTATPPRWSARPSRSPRSSLDYYDLGISHFLIRGFDPLSTPSTTAAS